MAKQESSKAKKNDDKRALEEEEELDGEEEDLDEDEEEDLEDEEDDDLEEDEEEEDRGRAAQVAPAAKVDAAEDEQPGWWLPHAVLGVLVAAGVLGFLGFFGSFLAKKDGVQHATSGSASAAAPSAAPAAPSGPKPNAQPPQPPKTAQPAPPPPSDILAAKRIVVRYKGSEGTPATVERSKEDAKKRAEEALKKIQGGAKFEEVAGEFSDEPGAKSTGGNMGNFKKDVYPGLTKVLEPTKIGEMTGVVETPYGYEILIRTK
ncbi:MAG: peptidylprolyl isomerase [Polyangiaceae bacterium]|nr:peptidylprolyl isomerase [Polyangiaceae bacterium]